MASILLLAHAPLASALKQVAAHVYPERSGALVALDVAPEATTAAVLAQARAVIDARPGEPWLVLTDVYGATPANVACALPEGSPVRVLAGVNVPMLWRALCYADAPLDDLTSRAQDGAGRGIVALPSTRPPVPCQPGQTGEQDKHHDQ